MSHFSLQQNAVGLCDEKRGLVSISDLKVPVVCPKPRRLGTLVSNAIRPLRYHMNHQVEVSDSKAGAELLDIILKKESDEYAIQAASPPSFYCGSPPARAANPLVQDARFQDEKLTPISQLSIMPPSRVSSPTASPCKGGGARLKFGLKPAEVRVEGFDCLNRDHQNSRIPAMA